MHRKRVSVADYPPTHCWVRYIITTDVLRRRWRFAAQKGQKKRERARERLKPRKGDERKDSILHPYK